MNNFNLNKSKKVLINQNKLIWEDNYSTIELDANNILHFNIFLLGMKETISTNNCLEAAWHISKLKFPPEDILTIKLSHSDLETALNSIELVVYTILGGDDAFNANIYNAEWPNDINIFIDIFDDIIFSWVSKSSSIADLVRKIKATDLELIFEKLVKHKLINFKNV